MAGITCVGVLGGGAPRIGTFTVVASGTFLAGEVAILTSNEAAEGTTGAPAIIGIAVEAVDNTVDGHSIRCFMDPYAIYQYNDGTAHAAGATLDMATGGMGLAASSSGDFTVIYDNAATEPTTFIITPGNHYLHTGG